jgi:TonB family protein
MRRHALSYGADELKQAMPRYWMYGFAISVVIHLGVLATQQLVKNADPIVSGPQVGTQGTRHVWVDLIPQIRGIVDEFPPARPGPIAKSNAGIPTPVKDNQTDPNQTIKSQVELRAGVTPVGNGEGEGGDIRGSTIEIPEPEPPPFTMVEKEAVVIRSVLPVYPEVARLAGLEGKVFVRIWVDKEGKCRKAEILRSTDDIFNEPALEAAQQFLFTPAYMNNGPVSVWMAVPFVFRLNGK